MKFIKQAFVDIIATLVIVSSVFFSNYILLIIIWVYTALLLAGKISALALPSLQKRAEKAADAVPDWFYHLTYLICSVSFAVTSEWYLFACWVLIWILSIISSFRGKK